MPLFRKDSPVQPAQDLSTLYADFGARIYGYLHRNRTSGLCLYDVKMTGRS